MALIISKISPIYFPMLMSDFPGSTNRIAACEKDELDYLQIWESTDTLNFQVNDTLNFSKDFGVVIGTDFYAATNVGSGYYNFSIPLSSYEGQIIEPQFVEGTSIGSITTYHDQAYPMRVYDPDDECVTCSRLFGYAGRCNELRVYYGTSSQLPSFTHYLRVQAATEYNAATVDSTLYKGSNFAWSTDYAEIESAFRFYTDFLPLWMHEKINLLVHSSFLTIDGGSFVYDSPFRTSEKAPTGNLYRGDMTLKKKSSPYAVAGCC